MIIVLVHDPRTGGANMSFEGGPPEAVHDLLYQMTDNLGQQLGKPPLPKQSGLTVAPANAVPANPSDLRARLDALKQQGPQ